MPTPKTNHRRYIFLFGTPDPRSWGAAPGPRSHTVTDDVLFYHCRGESDEWQRDKNSEVDLCSAGGGNGYRPRAVRSCFRFDKWPFAAVPSGAVLLAPRTCTPSRRRRVRSRPGAVSITAFEDTR